MQRNITAGLVATLQPARHPYEIRDARLTGFLVRVQPSGRSSYICQFARGRRITLGRVGVLSVSAARELAIQHLSDVTKGIDPIAKRYAERAATLKDYLDNEYGPWFTTNRKSGHAILKRIRWCFCKWLGQKRLDQISPLEVDRWRSSRLREGISPVTLNRDLQGLKAALSKAVEWGLIAHHPLARVKPFRKDKNSSTRYLSSEEEVRLRHALDVREQRMREERQSANAWRRVRRYEEMAEIREDEFADYLKPVVLLTINTGLRRGEVFNLRWSHVTEVPPTIEVEGPNSKSGQTRHVPLNQEARAILRQWRRQGPGRRYVFPSLDGKRMTTIKNSWTNLVKLAELDRFRFHDLRHHFASRLVMAGIPLNTVRELMGHADIDMTLRYAHLAPRHKADAVEVLGSPRLVGEKEAAGR